MIVFIENYEQYVMLYFEDGHHELRNQKLCELGHFVKEDHKYKTPIQIGNDLLYPTQSKKEYDCCWVNYDALDCSHVFLLQLLKQKQLLDKVLNAYLMQKKNHLLNLCQ